MGYGRAFGLALLSTAVMLVASCASQADNAYEEGENLADVSTWGCCFPGFGQCQRDLSCHGSFGDYATNCTFGFCAPKTGAGYNCTLTGTVQDDSGHSLGGYTVELLGDQVDPLSFATQAGQFTSQAADLPCDLREVRVYDWNNTQVFPGQGQAPMVVDLSKSSSIAITVALAQPDPNVQCTDPVSGQALAEFDCMTNFVEVGDACGDGLASCCPDVQKNTVQQCTDQGLHDIPDGDTTHGVVRPCVNTYQYVKRDPNACAWASGG
jgi:hypothetical protein